MALMKSKEIPKDAVPLDELEAARYAWDVVSNWKSLSDTWALKYTPAILGGINAISGAVINSHYRMRFRLSNYGYLSSVIPITLMPGLLTALFHRHSVSTNMLLMKSDICPICYEVRSAAVQLGLGLFYPMILGPVSALMFANRYGTYRVPHLTEGPKVLFKFLRQHTRPLTGTLAYIVAIQLAAASVLTYFEQKNNINLRQKMLELENKLLAEEWKES